MTAAEVEAVLKTARSYWLGGLFGVSFEELLTTWPPVLEPFARTDVEHALSEMLMAGRTEFPPLPVLLAAMAERRRVEQQRLTADRLDAPRLEAGERSVTQAVADFDKSASDMRSAERAQAAQIMRDSGKSESWLAKRLAEIDVIGPFEERARKLVAGEIPPEQLGTWWPEQLERSAGPERIGAILSRTPEPPPPVVDDTPTGTDRVMGAELAGRLMAGERFGPEQLAKLSPGLRRAAREAVQEARAKKAVTA